jgi:ssDNA-binding Zn-finger/Zn-ribbon topoisomerase 1
VRCGVAQHALMTNSSTPVSVTSHCPVTPLTNLPAIVDSLPNNPNPTSLQRNAAAHTQAMVPTSTCSPPRSSAHLATHPSACTASPTASASPGRARVCPACHDGILLLRIGKRGPFMGCNAYPECRHIDKRRLTPEQLTSLPCHSNNNSHASAANNKNNPLTNPLLVPVALVLHTATPATFVVQLDCRELDAGAADAVHARVAAVVRKLATRRIHMQPLPPTPSIPPLPETHAADVTTPQLASQVIQRYCQPKTAHLLHRTMHR